MASSKGSPGPHDRKVDPATGKPPPKTKCIRTTAKGTRCKRDALDPKHGRLLCKSHDQLAAATVREREPSTANSGIRRRRRANAETNGTDLENGPSPTVRDLTLAGSTTAMKRSHATQFVLNEQARAALAKIGTKPDPTLDPKRVLLDTVEAAWRQRQVWEQMLAAIPEDDWAQLGETPIPGVIATSKGQRIEVIQKFLLEATKTSARVSKLAIDAGIEERLVRLAEEQSALIADTVRAAVLATIGYLSAQGLITPSSEAAATEAAMGAAASHLRALAAGSTTGEQGVVRRAEPEIYESIAHEMNELKQVG